MALKIRRNQEKMLAALTSWTKEDEHLAGLPDPLGTDTSGPDADVLAQWERNFMKAILEDTEYWNERGGITKEQIDWINHVDPSQIDIEALRAVLSDNATHATSAKPIETHKAARSPWWAFLFTKSTRKGRQ